MNIDAKLNNARTLLNELGNSIANLVNSSPDVFADPGIKSALDGFLDAFEEAVERLENPSFRIATIGTTSSGKSTIVNALIGRKIAPIEAGEMSGGVLTLKHSQESKLIIKETEDAAWETGEWTRLTDDDLYQRIRSVMHSYHEARQKREYVAPQITAYVSLLPACDPILLGLPPGIGVELIDLPGLKSVQDRTNLATIQQQVNKAFSLVALDYMQVDDSHRKRLLEELKKVVEYLQGRTDSMIFILNRVDQRGADDLPLDVRINKLRAEIKETLLLAELPDVLPFNARLLYYAQCAWGAGALNEPSTVDKKTRLAFLKAMFRDCMNTIKSQYTAIQPETEPQNIQQNIQQKLKNIPSIFQESAEVFRSSNAENTDLRDVLKSLPSVFHKSAEVFRSHVLEDRNLKTWFREIEDKIDRDQPIDDQTMQEIVSYCLEWSGGRELWQRFQVRVEESFDELVIFPALVEVFEKYLALSEMLDVLIQTRKIYNQEQVELERSKIAKIRLELQSNLKKIDKELKSETKQLIGELKTNDTKTKIKIQKDAKKKKRHRFDEIIFAIDEVEGDLTKVLVVPVRDSLKKNLGAFELKDKLQEITSPALADDIAKTCDNVSRRLSKFSPQSEYLFKSVRADDNNGKKELEHDERYVRLLYHCMRQAISVRAEFFLQGKVEKFEKALESLIEEQVKRLKICLSEETFASSINLEKATISDLRKKLPGDLLKLPEKIFDLEDNIKQKQTKKKEVVGQKTEYETRTKTEYENYTEYYQSGSCYKSTKSRTKSRPVTRNYTEAVTRDITDDVEYVELFLPSPDLMAKQWLSGIEKGKDSLWDILLDWISQRLDDVSSIFEESVDDITNLAERALEKQLRIIEENFENEKQFWQDFEIKKNRVNALCKKLEKVCSESSL
ncbi:dynamin family protein [Anabaena aphanizomenioides LEGE 00250]|uniref:Dynamin family protein n=2 Tax=Sphaerospermopsis aphanizomenoides TaxID=459663 RepID=A0ABR9VA41_9CYAN|nr:dynamin family protein [Sphaerospermopsis aphanizomenoides LEGE 00250]